MSAVTCGVCGETFHVKPSHASRRRFCSQACKAVGTRVPLEDRLEGKYVITESGCWEWTSKINTNGYGLIAASVVEQGRRPRHLRAHRVMYEARVGPIPAGLDIDHLCRNTRCVNPDHLEPVSRAENLRRGGGEHAGGKTHCKRGHEFTPENTYITRVGYRNCRECHRLNERVRRDLLRRGLPLENVPALF